MKFKNAVKNIFTTYLIIIVVCLYVTSFIGYNKSSNLASSLMNTKVENQLIDYRVIDKNEYINNKCGEQQYFYENDGYMYYLTCASIDNIYVEWTNGKITTLMYALEKDNVDIDYLIVYKGLKAQKILYEK